MAAIDIGPSITVLNGVRDMTALPAEQRQNLLRAIDTLKTSFTQVQTQVNDLTTQNTQQATQITALTSQVDQLKQDNAAKQATIDRLTAAAAAGAHPAKPLDLAASFQTVFDTIHNQALAATTSTASTIKTLDVEIKGLVTIQTDAAGGGATPALVLPAADKPIDPGQLSTMKLSFAAIPVTARKLAQPPPAPGGPSPAGPSPAPPAGPPLRTGAAFAESAGGRTEPAAAEPAPAAANESSSSDASAGATKPEPPKRPARRRRR